MGTRICLLLAVIVSLGGCADMPSKVVSEDMDFNYIPPAPAASINSEDRMCCHLCA
jgi:hypothetical protein